jgi:two-component system chemotaxis sensor kinase CheA
MSMEEALTAFYTESRELLEQMEAALLQLEKAPQDEEIINAIFRAAHTIKGSAGIFGLDHIVSFTHVAESVLDKVRSGLITIDRALSGLLLRTSDHLRDLIEHQESGSAQSDASLQQGQALARALSAYLVISEPGDLPMAMTAPTAATAWGNELLAETDHWHLSLRFGRGTIQDGFDPLSFLRYLGTFGEITHVEALVDNVPRLAELEPDECHLGFEVGFKTDADKAKIESAFDFVREDSQVRILPPRSKVHEYVDLIAELPEADLRLGDMLVRCGTLTQTELDAALDAQTVQGREGHGVAPLGQMLVDGGQVHAEVVTAALNKQSNARESSRGAEAQMLRVDAAKLDHLIDLVGELIIAGAGALLVARQHRIKDLVQATAAISSLMEDVRDSALNLRMVQIGGTFNRFQRVVRDVSTELGKDIVLHVSGAETELDKAVVERLADPLTHLVRNAMDHGIESAVDRAQAGKPAQGTVSLHAHHEAGSIVVEVSDDGGGLPKERILRKAVERGLVAADATLTEQDIYHLIFQPGFSTAEQISNLSGRGVGMDVVKRNITALRGNIDVRSREGQGTTISIRLPLTLAIIDGFLLGVGRSSYVVPLNVVVECIEMSSPQTDDKDWLDLRGEVLPLVRLRELYDVEGEPGRRQNVVVVKGGDTHIGLVVDQLMGELQTVIKPLGKVFQNAPGVGGFTILGSGQVALLLDVPNLIRQVTRNTDSAIHRRQHGTTTEQVA